MVGHLPYRISGDLLYWYLELEVQVHRSTECYLACPALLDQTLCTRQTFSPLVKTVSTHTHTPTSLSPGPRTPAASSLYTSSSVNSLQETPTHNILRRRCPVACSLRAPRRLGPTSGTAAALSLTWRCIRRHAPASDARKHTQFCEAHGVVSKVNGSVFCIPLLMRDHRCHRPDPSILWLDTGQGFFVGGHRPCRPSACRGCCM